MTDDDKILIVQDALDGISYRELRKEIARGWYDEVLSPQLFKLREKIHQEWLAMELPDLVEAVGKGHFIQCIKTTRERTGMGLRACKDAVYEEFKKRGWRS